jgi:zinc transport system substrate-binding protein
LDGLPMTFRLVLAFFLLAALPARAAPQVLATIKPVHSLVASVMGNAGAPVLLIGGAASEHGFALKTSDARKITRADLIFQIGPEMESYLVRPLRTLGRSATIVSLNRAPGIQLLDARKGGLWGSETGAKGQKDPHIWLDPQNAIAMVRAIEAALAKADPSGAALYADNATRTIFVLQGLENRTAAITGPLRAKPYIVFHDAYHYFEARFGLSPAGAVTVAPDRPVGARRIADLRRSIDSQHITCIFREPQFEPRLIDTLAEGRNVKIGVLDPLGADLTPGPDLYGQLIDRLALSLSQCLAAPRKKA